jgi:hypothetical protein
LGLEVLSLRLALGKMQDYLKIIKAKKKKKKAGDMAQVVEHLSSKFETMSSNSSNAKKKKKIRLQWHEMPQNGA